MGYLMVEAIVAVLLLYCVGLAFLDSLPLFKRMAKQFAARDQLLLCSQTKGEQALANPSSIGVQEEQVKIDARTYRIATEISAYSVPHLNQIVVSIYADDKSMVLRRCWLAEVP